MIQEKANIEPGCDFPLREAKIAWPLIATNFIMKENRDPGDSCSIFLKGKLIHTNLSHRAGLKSIV